MKQHYVKGESIFWLKKTYQSWQNQIILFFFFSVYSRLKITAFFYFFVILIFFFCFFTPSFEAPLLGNR